MSDSNLDLATRSGDDLLAELADDFLRRYRAGEHSSVDDYACKHPELADRIRDLFPAVIAMEQPGAGGAFDCAPPTERAGAMIDRYKLLERIGEGGFGVVYMAEQQQPVRRKVALKVIKLGSDTRQVIARFEAERQALALMDHENIAKVLDAGATAAGRPYFVMELVYGVPITQFCDENELPPRDRLELFVQVCRAVQHAHTKGIIHRDIKPTNVLVTLHEGIPVPKVIDFGVAKATGQRLTEKTLFTHFQQMVGTPLYMSPEQAEMTGIDVDTRSDVYSLGVLLYELLTGTTPVDKDRLRQAAFDEVRRIIREDEPPRPSTRLSTMGEQARRISATRRKSDPKQLGRLMRGELDWIVMKALEKERARRYETAYGLACDVERYLRDEPVEACPPSAVYRFRRVVRRNKGRVTAAALVLASLVAGMAGTTWGMIRAERARRDAVAAQRAETERAAGERQARKEAQERLAQIGSATEILATLFRDFDPIAAERAGVTSLDLLSRRLSEAARQLEGETVGEPLVVARLQHLLGISLRQLGYPKQALEVLVKARETRERMLGSDHLDTVAAKHDLAQLYAKQREDTLAETLFREVLAIRTAKLGADHLDTLATKHQLAWLYYAQQKYASAETLCEEVLTLRTRKLGADNLDTLATKHLVGLVCRFQGNFDRSEALLKESLAGRTAQLGADHRDTDKCRHHLAQLYQSQGRFDLAEALLEEVVALRTVQLGSANVDTSRSQNDLASVYAARRKFDLAEPLFKEVLAFRIASLGLNHAGTVSSQYDLAKVYRSTDRPAEAIALLETTLERGNAIGHAEVHFMEADLGVLYCDAGRFADAEPLLLDAYNGIKQAESQTQLQSNTRQDALQRLVQLYDAWGKPQDAAIWRKELGSGAGR